MTIECSVCGRKFCVGQLQPDWCYEFSVALQKKHDEQNVEIKDSAIKICRSCFCRGNNDRIMRALWRSHELKKKENRKKGIAYEEEKNDD